MRRLLVRLVVLAMLLVWMVPAQAAVRSGLVEYRQGDATLEGYLAYDDALSGKRPGILIVHEWWGLNDYVKGRADELSQMGYVAFAADIYGKGVGAKTPAEAGRLSNIYVSDRKLMRTRVNAGLDMLLKNQYTDPARVAAIGYCFGGMTVLELARSGANVAGVVSFHGELNTPDPKLLRRTSKQRCLFSTAPMIRSYRPAKYWPSWKRCAKLVWTGSS